MAFPLLSWLAKIPAIKAARYSGNSGNRQLGEAAIELVANLPLDEPGGNVPKAEAAQPRGECSPKTTAYRLL
jgi:hypothetical protein